MSILLLSSQTTFAHCDSYDGELEQYYWRGGLWTSSHFIASCGGAALDIVKKYIENQ